MQYSDDAKRRLAALHQPIPRPTKAAVKQNREEEESRREATTYDRLMSVVKKGPDVAEAAKVGEPTLVDPTPVDARGVIQNSMRQAMGPAAGDRSVAGEIVKSGPPAANEPAPRSDTAVTPANASPFAHSSVADPNELQPAASASEMKPSGAPDPNELKPAEAPAAAAEAAVPPPVQVNEIQPGQPSSNNSTVASSSSTDDLATEKDISSSKKKKKTGLKKVISF
jgi:hypothetical protein